LGEALHLPLPLQGVKKMEQFSSFHTAGLKPDCFTCVRNDKKVTAAQARKKLASSLPKREAQEKGQTKRST